MCIRDSFETARCGGRVCAARRVRLECGRHGAPGQCTWRADPASHPSPHEAAPSAFPGPRPGTCTGP
eukprot:2383791-Prymnesium_polylepis.1